MSCLDELSRNAGNEQLRHLIDGPGPLANHYEVKEQVGGGGMGVVYKAIKTNNNDAAYAIKFPWPGLVDSCEVDRFVKESRVLSHLTDVRGLIRIHEVGISDKRPFVGKPFIVTDLIEGVELEINGKTCRCVELRDFLNEQTIVSTTKAVRVIARCARALARVHQRLMDPTNVDTAIVHRDLKPENILLTEPSEDGVDFDTQIIDFGLAADTITQTNGKTLGTLPYMAPEQLHQTGAGPKVDVWALGVILFEMLTGKRPFIVVPDSAESELDQMRALVTREPALRLVTDRILRRICKRCLAINPDHRYTAQELAEALHRYTHHFPQVGDSVYRRIRLWAIRHSIAALLLVASLMIAVAGGGYYDAFHSEKIEYYETFVRQWGEPIGVGRLTDALRASRLRSVRIERIGRFGLPTRIAIVNQFGSAVPDQNLSSDLLLSRPTNIFSDADSVCQWSFRRDSLDRIISQIAEDQNRLELYTLDFSCLDQGAYPAAMICTYREPKSTISQQRSLSGACKLRLFRTLEGFDQRVEFLDENEKPVSDAEGRYAIEFSFDSRAVEISGLVKEVRFLNADNRPAFVDNYAKARFQYDSSGRRIAVDFLDDKDRPRAHIDGYSGIRWSWSVLRDGSPIQRARFVETSDGMERPAWHIKGYCGYDTSWSGDSQGKFIRGQQSFVDDRGEPAWHVDRYAICLATVSNSGDLVSLEYRDEQGQPTRSKLGAATIAFQRNDENVEITFLDTKGQPVYKAPGVPKLNDLTDQPSELFSLNRVGSSLDMINGSFVAIANSESTREISVERQSHRDSVPDPVPLVTGPSMARNSPASAPAEPGTRGEKLDLRDSLSEGETSLNRQDPAESGERPTRIKMKPNDRGQLESISYFAGDRLLNTTRWEYHDRFVNSWTREENLSPDGQLTNSPMGYAVRLRTIDSHGSWQEESYQEWSEGQLKPFKVGGLISKTTRSLNEQGLEAEVAYFDGETPVKGYEGFAKKKTTYSSSGQLTQIQYLDSAGQLVPGPAGFAESHFKYDQMGRVRCLIGYGYRQSAGFAEKHVELDAMRRSRRDTYFDMNGQPVSIGGFGFEIIRNRMGDVVEGRYLDVNGRLTPGGSKYAYYKSEFDKNGYEIRRRYFDVADRPTDSPTGESGWTATYSMFGKEAIRSFIDSNGQPAKYTLDDGEITSYENLYDEYGKLLRRILRGFDGSKGFDAKKLFFENGDVNRTVRAEYVHSGHRTGRNDGVAYWTQVLDQSGNVLERRYFDNNDRLSNNSEGYAIDRSNYNTNGFETERKFLDQEEQAVVISNGYHRCEAKYDERGNQTAKRYYDTVNELSENDQGYSIFEAEYNEANHATRKRWAGYDVSKAGYYESICRYDGTLNERLIEQVFLDKDGEAAKTSFGYSRYLTEYDNNKLKSRRFEGCDLSKFLAETVVEYLLDGDLSRPVRLVFLDAGGMPRRNVQGYMECLKEYSREGTLLRSHLIGRDPNVTGGYTQNTTTWFSGDETKPEVIEYQNDKGEFTPGKGGWSREEFFYDAEGVLQSGAFEGFDSQTVGYSQQRQTYWRGDSKKYISREYFDNEGQPARIKPQGCLGTKWAYSDDGKLVSRSDFGFDGSVTGGWVTIESEFQDGDESKITEKRYLDETGELARGGKSGFWLETRTYDHEGRLERGTLEGYDEQSFGYSQIRRAFWNGRIDKISSEEYLDSKGSPVRVYLDTPFGGYQAVRTQFGNSDGLPMVRSITGYDPEKTDGYTTIDMRYRNGDELKPVERTYKDSGGRLKRTKNGYHTETWTYDDNGLLLTSKNLGFDSSTSGYSSEKLTFWRGDINKVLRREYFDEHGSPSRHIPGGNQGYESAYSEEGQLLSTTYFGFDPEKTGGYIRKVLHFLDGDINKITLEEYLGENEIPATGPNGYSRLENHFADELLTSRTTSGYSGFDGYDSMVETFVDGDSNKLLCRRYLDKSGEPAKCSEGFSTVEYEHDDQKRRFGEIQTGFDASLYGFSRRIFRFLPETMSKATEFRFLTESGQPAHNGDFVSAILSEYDENSLLKARTIEYVDSTGASKVKSLFVDGDATKPVQFDFIDRNNELLHFDGFPRLTSKYDDNGRLLSQTKWAFDGDNLFHRSILEFEYHESNQVQTERNFNTSGELWPGSFGFSIRKAVIDEFGNLVEQRFFDSDGKLQAGPEGYARLAAEVDQRGLLSKVTYFDVADHVTRTSSGYSQETYRWDEQQRLQERIFEDEESHPVNSSLGYAKITYSYGPNGQVSTEHRDAEGKKVPTSVVIKSIVPNFTAERLGLRPGDILQKLGGIEIQDVVEFQSQMSANSGTLRTLLIIRDGKELEFRFGGAFLGVELHDKARDAK